MNWGGGKKPFITWTASYLEKRAYRKELREDSAEPEGGWGVGEAMPRRVGVEVNSDIHPVFVFSSQEIAQGPGSILAYFTLGVCPGILSPSNRTGEGNIMLCLLPFLSLCFTPIPDSPPSHPSLSVLPRLKMCCVASKYYFLY